MSSPSAMAAFPVRQATGASRFWNVLAALILLALFAPVMLATAAAIVALSGRSPLVGPRPLTERELRKYYGHAAQEVLCVKPGVTGLWQVTGRSRLTYAQRLEMDLFLVRNRSWRLSLTILLRTVPAVLNGKDGW